ncbi:MAG: hypothetical protein NC121_07140 [Blautia sp.]|nr:hypothetical protein [Blautia sp.]
MGNIHNDEVDIIGAIREFSQVYQTYQDNLNDPKLEDIRNTVVIPVAQIGQNLLQAFDSMEPMIKNLKDSGIIEES